MSAEQMVALLPEGSVNTNVVSSAAGPPHYGVAQIGFQPRIVASAVKGRFAGIDSIQATLFDGSLTELSVTYTGASSYPVRGPVWRNVDDFIMKLSEAFALPPAKDWVELSRSAKRLQCSGFNVTASIETGAGSISLRSTIAYEDTVRKRAWADEESRRRDFKP